MNHDYRNDWPRTPKGVWFGIIAGPTVWFLHLLAGWWITEQACVDGNSAWGPLSPAGVRWLEIGISLFALLIVLLSLLATWRHWRTPTDSVADRMEGYSRTNFMASFGLLMAGVFTVALLWAGYNTAVLPVCEVMR